MNWFDASVRAGSLICYDVWCAARTITTPDWRAQKVWERVENALPWVTSESVELSIKCGNQTFISQIVRIQGENWEQIRDDFLHWFSSSIPYIDRLGFLGITVRMLEPVGALNNEYEVVGSVQLPSNEW